MVKTTFSQVQNKNPEIFKRLGNFISVENLENDHGPIPNQFLINFQNGSIFQSYKSIIAIEIFNAVYLTEHWNYSSTIGRYRNIYLGEKRKETEKKIKTGEYILL